MAINAVSNAIKEHAKKLMLLILVEKLAINREKIANISALSFAIWESNVKTSLVKLRS